VLWRTCWGTPWGPDGNPLGTLKGTNWEPGKTPHTHTHTKEKKKTRHLECMLGGHSDWMHENSLPKRVHHPFWHGLKYPLQRIPSLTYWLLLCFAS